MGRKFFTIQQETSAQTRSGKDRASHPKHQDSDLNGEGTNRTPAPKPEGQAKERALVTQGKVRVGEGGKETEQVITIEGLTRSVEAEQAEKGIAKSPTAHKIVQSLNLTARIICLFLYLILQVLK